jgi:hypothetical protein
MMKRLENGQFRWPPIEDGMLKRKRASHPTLISAQAGFA